MSKAIRHDVPHRVSPMGQDYESLARQNETLVSLGISPTSSGSHESRRYATDPNADRVGVEVDYEDLAETLGLRGKKKGYLRVKVDDD